MAFKVQSIESSDDGQTILVTFEDSQGNQVQERFVPEINTASALRICVARLTAHAEGIEMSIADLKKEVKEQLRQMVILENGR